MAKLNIRKELFQPIKNIEKKNILRDKKHQTLREEAKAKIKKELEKKDKAYESAKNYLSS